MREKKKKQQTSAPPPPLSVSPSRVRCGNDMSLWNGTVERLGHRLPDLPTRSVPLEMRPCPAPGSVDIQYVDGTTRNARGFEFIFFEKLFDAQDLYYTVRYCISI